MLGTAAIGIACFLAGLVAFSLCIGVAVLRYRMFDIDRVISRTLAYAIVTGLLVGVYAGIVLLATEVLRFHSTVAVAAATLAAAALFNPVRRRVQKIADRRFNRARYDADRIITAFAARLQDAVDVDAVQADLASSVQQALEPAYISVWMRAGGGQCPVSACWTMGAWGELRPDGLASGRELPGQQAGPRLRTGPDTSDLDEQASKAARQEQRAAAHPALPVLAGRCQRLAAKSSGAPDRVFPAGPGMAP